MSDLSFSLSYSPRLFAAILSIILLSVTDAYFTLDLVGRGAKELNPIMAYYLEKSPLVFFAVKYLITCAAILITMSVKADTRFAGGLQRRFLFAFYIIALALVVQWQVFLLLYAVE